jgi:hypothetical protein
MKILLVLALLLLIPRFARTVLYYFPDWLPQNETYLRKKVARPMALVDFVKHSPHPLRHHAPPAYVKEVSAWLLKNLQGKGRVVVQEFQLAEYLAATTDLPLLSGIEQRAIHHGDAHLFRLSEEGHLPGKALKDYFERYAVRYLVCTEFKAKLEWRKDLLKPVKLIKGIRIYQTLIDPSYFLIGKGMIAKQEFNHIHVAEALGPEVVLRFHWMETLRCRPNCKVLRKKITGDRVGFIRIKNPPANFEIYNSYQFD